MQLTLEDRIRERAYFISQASGGAGDDRQFWLMALSSSSHFHNRRQHEMRMQTDCAGPARA